MSWAPQRLFTLKDDQGQLLSREDGSIVLFQSPMAAQQEADSRPESWTVYTITY